MQVIPGLIGGRFAAMQLPAVSTGRRGEEGWWKQILLRSFDHCLPVFPLAPLSCCSVIARRLHLCGKADFSCLCNRVAFFSLTVSEVLDEGFSSLAFDAAR